MGLFSKATHAQAYLKAGLFGFQGSGKTHTAAKLAVGMVKHLRSLNLEEGNRPAFFLDTETGSDYVLPLFKQAGVAIHTAKTRAFSDLVPAVREASKEGSILLIDSITHFWREFTEAYAKKKNRQRGLEFSDWAYLKAEWGKFTDEYVNSRAHIIMCGRAGYEFDFFQDDAGKRQIEKSGVKMKAESETGYEPSLLILMERRHDLDTNIVTRRAFVVKDRFDLIDGKHFDNPVFENFLPHVSSLNLGGNHVGIDTSRTSEGMIQKDDSTWKYQKQQAEIILDEIQTLLVKHYPSTGKDDKAAKINMLEKHLGTGSWKRIETMSMDDLKRAFNAMRDELDGTPDLPAFDLYTEYMTQIGAWLPTSNSRELLDAIDKADLTPEQKQSLQAMHAAKVVELEAQAAATESGEPAAA